VKLLYIHQYFFTNQGSGPTRSYDVSRRMVDQGHEVTVVTGWHPLSGMPRPRRWKLVETRDIDGIRVRICNIRYENKLKVPQRLAAFAGFAGLATVVSSLEQGMDLVFATSTPLTVGIPGRIASFLRRRPYVFEVRDLWPEDLLAAGRIKEGWQYRGWQALEWFGYLGASRILLVSKGFHDRMLERGFAPERLKTIPLGAEKDLFENLRPATSFLQGLGLEGKTVAVYAGAHGDANGLFQVLDAAELLLDREDIAILLVGGGGKRDELHADARARGLCNVHFAPAMPKRDLVHVLAACDIGLMILKQIVRPRWVTPNKLFDYMFCGLPVLVNFPGTTAELVEAEGIGAATEPGSAEAMADQIRAWADDPEEARRRGELGRRIGLRDYTRATIADRLASLFQQVIDEHEGRT